MRAVAVNRKARFDYEIEERIEAGLVLVGSEVKALRTQKVSIQEAFAGESSGELWLMNAMFGVYAASVRHDRHEERRPRKLLVKRRQRDRLLGKVKRERYAIVPLKLYFNERGYAKVELGLAKGRRQVDKRLQIKTREWERRRQRLG